MLKINGEYICGVPSSNFIDHVFFSFSPTLFFDYFKKNGCEIKCCYISKRSPLNFNSEVKNYKYNYVGSEIPIISNTGVELLLCIKKVKQVEKILKPFQSFYNKSSEWKGENKIEDHIIKRNKFDNLKIFVKKILFSKIMPSFITNVIFFYFRSKNIKKIRKDFDL